MGGPTTLFLEYDAALVPEGGAAVFGPRAGAAARAGWEPAGDAFHRAALRQAGLGPADAGASGSDAGGATDSAGPSRQSSAADFSSLNGGGGGGDDDAKFKGKGRRRKGAKKRGGPDFYALLGLQHERWTATESQIRLAYRRVALEHHPDKRRAAAGGDEAKLAAAEENFKALQEAYETLSDPARRREFDSLDAFDDSLPGEAEAGAAPGAFYAAFGAAFRRNAKWSSATPVPDLGEEEADDDAVEAFYDFWYGFRSWREFPHADEEDAEQAESRDEKRWIERHNAKLREGGKKAEVRRIRDFVELARRLDPRIARRRAAREAEREARVAAREAGRAAEAAAAAAAAAEAEAARAAEEEAAGVARKARQLEKKATQNERKRLRRLTLGEGAPAPPPREDDVEALCARLELPAMTALCAALEAAAGDAAGRAATLEAALATVRTAADLEEAAREAAAAAAAEARLAKERAERAERLARLRAWDEEEVRLLRKALEKFPPGTSKRWETVAAAVRTRTVEEVVDMAKHGLMSGRAPGAGAEAGLKVKGGAGRAIGSEATTRAAVFSDVEVQLQGEAAAAAGAAAEAASAAAAAAAAAAPKAAPAAKAPPSAAKAAAPNGAAPPANGAAAPAAAAPAAPAAEAEGPWGEAENLALVKALKDVAKDAADRWEQVAAAVGSRSKAACARRFKEMREAFKSKKAGA
jgi:DnaJ family protein C protein 2